MDNSLVIPEQGVYFISLQGGNGNIKIGHSNKLYKRLKNTFNRCGMPIKVELLIETSNREESLSLERMYHEKYFANFYQGEWFAPDNQMISDIARLQHNHEFIPFIFGETGSCQSGSVIYKLQKQQDQQE